MLKTHLWKVTIKLFAGLFFWERFWLQTCPGKSKASGEARKSRIAEAEVNSPCSVRRLRITINHERLKWNFWCRVKWLHCSKFALYQRDLQKSLTIAIEVDLPSKLTPCQHTEKLPCHLHIHTQWPIRHHPIFKQVLSPQNETVPHSWRETVLESFWCCTSSQPSCRSLWNTNVCCQQLPTDA